MNVKPIVKNGIVSLLVLTGGIISLSNVISYLECSRITEKYYHVSMESIKENLDNAMPEIIGEQIGKPGNKIAYNVWIKPGLKLSYRLHLE